MWHKQRIIVIDIGSGFCKAGWSGDETPWSVLASIIGPPIAPHGGWVPLITPTKKSINVFIGDKLINAMKSRTLKVSHPIQHGTVIDRDGMVNLLKYLLYVELRSDPEKYPLLLSEPTLTSSGDRQWMTETVFETFDVPSFYLANHGVLALYSYGRTTGLVVDIGDGLTQIVPIYDSHHIPRAARIVKLGGSDVTSFLQQLMYDRDYTLPKFAEHDIFRTMKERHAYVALDFEAEMRRAANTTDVNVAYILPDGNEIVLGKERSRCTEILLKPSLLHGNMREGVHENVFNTINACDVEIHQELYQNIVLSGGSTLFPGFRERLEQEIISLAPPTAHVGIVASEERKDAVWRGGSILASLEAFPEIAITRHEYNNVGSRIVDIKCF
jgi:actin-related protein